jgi:hypothetical protein
MKYRCGVCQLKKCINYRLLKWVFLRSPAGVSRKDKEKDKSVDNGCIGGARFCRCRKEIVSLEQAYAKHDR